MSHPHAHLMAEYAKDAAESDVPWERWQCRAPHMDEWEHLVGHPTWNRQLEYRRAPQYWDPENGPYVADVTHNVRYWPLGMTEEARLAGIVRKSPREAKELAHLLRTTARLHAWACEHDAGPPSDRIYTVYEIITDTGKCTGTYATQHATRPTDVRMSYHVANQCAQALDKGKLVLDNGD